MTHLIVQIFKAKIRKLLLNLLVDQLLSLFSEPRFSIIAEATDIFARKKATIKFFYSLQCFMIISLEL